MKHLNLTIGEATREVSSLLFGLFLEDINFSCDGGLNSNLVNNHSFDGVYLETGFDTPKTLAKARPNYEYDRLRYWESSGVKVESHCTEAASEKNPWYARVTSAGCGFIKNKGYNGNMKHINECAIYVCAGHTYDVSCYLRNISFDGGITAFVEDTQGNMLTDKGCFKVGEKWKQHATTVTAQATGYGRFVIMFEGVGTVDIDCINFADSDVVGKNDPQWSGGHFRKDLVETIVALNPKFMRFPGGCIVEGICLGNEYIWKDTIGPMIDRIPAPNLWATQLVDQGYCQSYQIGFYEYFLLCETLGIEPMPIVWAGISCQIRSNDFLATDSAEFREQVVQNALDLIEYANGDPKTNKWAKMRADAGHPKPFNMRLIGIGNENFDEDYHEKFNIIKSAIDDKYPGMSCVFSAGLSRMEDKMLSCWDMIRKNHPNVYVDEHYYKNNDWFYEHTTRYDSYPRGTAKVFLGEYAANDFFTEHVANTYGSALAEAAFLTGIERNSDVVGMVSYAPLYCMSGSEQWNHNLINFNPQAVLKTANYYVQQMFSAHIGDHVVDIQGTLPTRVFASATKDKSSFYIKLVNASEESVKCNINLPVTGKNASFITLEHDNMESVNTLTFDGVPCYQVIPRTTVVDLQDSNFTCELESQSFTVVVIEKP